MYADKKQQHQQSGTYRGQPNRRSWPQKNPKYHRRTGSSTFIDRDGDTEMSSGAGGAYRGRNKGRFNPGYGGRYNKNKHLNTGWWKIIVHDADKFDKEHFFKMLDNTTNESIDPQGTRVEKNKLVFWVKNPRAKDAIRNQSGKLTLKDHTINMFAVPSGGPEVVLTKDEHKAKICNALIKRYHSTSQILDLSEFHRDPDMAGIGNRLYQISGVLGELITEKCADMVVELDLSGNNLKHTGCLREILSACKTLKKVKLDNNYINTLVDLKNVERNAANITHLSMINTPIKNLMDDAQYISDLRKMFPKLIQLDGLPLPEKIKFETEEQNILPPAQKYSILLEPGPRKALENFFLQYVKFHDTGNASRSQLAPAYDDTCIMSIAVTWRNKNDSKHKFPTKMPAELIRRNRNFKHCSRAEQRESRLFIGRENVVKELCEMGDTKHMLQTLNIDTSAMCNNHVTAVLSGIIDTSAEYRTFSRTFILMGNPTNGSFLIINDQMTVIRSSSDVVQKVESPDFGNAPSTSNVNREALVKQIQEATKMIRKFCEQCLEAAGWDFQKAMNIFMEMKAKGSIPSEVFLK